jgi:CRISPR-associated endonuclease Csn1
MKILLKHLGVLTEKELNEPGCAWPWLLAARVLRGGQLLTWRELWDVLRWYAHNRGYDGNRRWSAAEVEAQKEDSEKEANARGLMGKYGTGNMAETFCAISGIDPLGKKKSANLPGNKRPKGQNAAFPRDVVEGEVRKILLAHFAKLKGLDAKLESALFSDWRAIPCAALKLPRRYEGGLLFGQLVPRFDNRIISLCPISGQKVPSRNCPEFLRFRWGMQLANIKIGNAKDRDLHPLSADHRVALDKQMHERGYLTPKELKDAVRGITGCERSNLETMLMHPDAKEALLLDPLQKLITSDDFAPFWKLLPERLQKRLRGQWRRGKSFTLAQIRKQLESLANSSAFDAELQRQIDAHNSNTRKKDNQLTREALLQKHFPSRKLRLDGRAAFARPLLQQSYDDVLAGKPHPKEPGGCLFLSEEIRAAQLNRTIAQQTNNHLVRHRLLILERLLADMVKEFADDEKQRVSKVTIEVNRDLREMSGMTAKAKAQDMGQRIANHHAVAEKLESALDGKLVNGRPIQITAGLIRKARVAEDLGWTCPYTGHKYEPINLVTRYVDKDHIVPRSQRPSDGLDSLVATFSEINKWKGNRTALQFVSEEQGKTVDALPNLSILSLTRYKQFVDGLESNRGHDDDKRRKKKRKELMLLAKYEEKEFVPRDLTQTSQLVRLGAQVLRKNLPHLTTGDVISLPGSVTGAVRRSWKVLGCLAAANPQVLDGNGEIKSKTDIRDITHLHHALDACVLGLASHSIPNNGLIWELVIKRKLNDAERQHLAALGVFGFNSENRFELLDLCKNVKDQICHRLAEKRVFQHLPASMSGLPTKQTVWRIFDPNDSHLHSRRIKSRLSAKGIIVPQESGSTVFIIRRKRKGSNVDEEAGGKVFHETKTWSWVYDEVEKTKLLGLSSGPGKLRVLKGVKLIDDNFGLALYPNSPIGEARFRPIRFFKVWRQINNLPKRADGKPPVILRRGHIITFERGRYAGKYWRLLGIEDSGKIRFFEPDFTRRIDKPENYERVMVTSMLRDGVRIVKTPLTGVPSCPTTSLA